MEHRYLIDYTLDGQQESLEVITESSILTEEEARKRVESAVKPYGKTNVTDIRVVKEKVDHVIDTDPETSASE